MDEDSEEDYDKEEILSMDSEDEHITQEYSSQFVSGLAVFAFLRGLFLLG